MPIDPPMCRSGDPRRGRMARAALIGRGRETPCGALVATALLAAAAMADPPRSIIQPAGELAAAAASRPLAGLSTSPASAVLREHLSLPANAGLIVEEVAAGSAAERAGLKKHDVLVSLDEQLLVLPEQLQSLLAGADSQTPHRLDLRRAGAAVTILLGPPPPSGAQAAPPPARPPEAAASPSPPPPPSAPAEPFVPPPGARRVGPDAVVLENRDCKLKVYRDADTFLTVRDARGWLLFNGPISTPKQRSLIPRRVRDRVERLEAMLDAVAVAEPLPGAPAAPPPPPAAEPSGPAAEIGLLDVPPIEIR